MHCLHVFDVSRISYHSTLKQQAPTHCFTCMVENYLDCTAKKHISYEFKDFNKIRALISKLLLEVMLCLLLVLPGPLVYVYLYLSYGWSVILKK